MSSEITPYAHCFTPFSQKVDQHDLPKKFTFPFYYQPHPLCIAAASALQSHLTKHPQWETYFQLESHNVDEASSAQNGKMFGVLVVKSPENELGYLSAFSGKNPFETPLNDFVPPVLDNKQQPDWLDDAVEQVNSMNQHINTAEKNPDIQQLTSVLSQEKECAHQAIGAHKALMKAAKKERKERRESAAHLVALKKLTLNAYQALKKELSQESIQHKNQLRDLNTFWEAYVENAQRNLHTIVDKIEALKAERKKLSHKIQNALFTEYQFLNARGEKQNLRELFLQHNISEPPAGAGDCAAPKLLQYAYAHNFTPIAMAEFWWGAAPKSEIRQHQNFYPACQSKCKPILTHMLQGLSVEENPLLINPAEGKTLEYIYQDDHLVVINKPAEFLSVPGKDINDSVYSRVKADFPHATGSLIVHRLDMSTSGLMVLALNSRTHKGLQKQFIERTVRKRYAALVEGTITEEKGSISLPLRVDLNDRPRQLVCYEHGKNAETFWEVRERRGSRTLLYLHPKTGRTHQLRMHCAHKLGLNSPIVGDDLYGKRDKRLHLHAQDLSFEHPITHKPMTFSVAANF